MGKSSPSAIVEDRITVAAMSLLYLRYRFSAYSGYGGPCFEFGQGPEVPQTVSEAAIPEFGMVEFVVENQRRQDVSQKKGGLDRPSVAVVADLVDAQRLQNGFLRTGPKARAGT